MINLISLKIFLDINKTGSFRSAAEKNFITQPAVSQQIHQLEEKLGTKLFERKHKTIYLSNAGKIFLPHAEKLLQQFDEARSSINATDDKNQCQCVIRIATIYSIGLYELKPIIKKYLAQYPKVELHLEYYHFDKIYEMVFNRTVDFGFTAFPTKHYGIISEIFSEDELVLVHSTNHSTSKNNKIKNLSDLNLARFISFSKTQPTGEAIDHYLKTNGVYPQLVSTYDNIETLKSAVELGLGYAILPKHTIQEELKKKIFKIVPNIKIDLKRPLAILCSKGQIFPKCAQVFYDSVLKKI